MKSALRSMAAASRGLLRNWQLAAVFGGVYATLLAACYLFVTTTEATAAQVLLTFALALAITVLFYTFQAMSVSYTRGEAHPNTLVRHALKNFWKLMLVSLPLLLLTWLLIHLLNRVNFYHATRFWPLAGDWRINFYPRPKTAQSASWQAVLSVSLRLVLFGVALPLAAVHLWIAAAHDGLKRAFRNAGRILLRAFRPQPVLIYTIGLVVFGLIPCLLLFTRTPTSNAWAEIWLLVARLVLAFAFFLFGWVVTLGALAKLSMTKEGADV